MILCDLGNSVSLKKNPAEQVVMCGHMTSCDVMPSGNQHTRESEGVLWSILFLKLHDLSRDITRYGWAIIRLCLLYHHCMARYCYL